MPEYKKIIDKKLIFTYNMVFLKSEKELKNLFIFLQGKVLTFWDLHKLSRQHVHHIRVISDFGLFSWASLFFFPLFDELEQRSNVGRESVHLRRESCELLRQRRNVCEECVRLRRGRRCVTTHRLQTFLSDNVCLCERPVSQLGYVVRNHLQSARERAFRENFEEDRINEANDVKGDAPLRLITNEIFEHFRLFLFVFVSLSAEAFVRLLLHVFVAHELFLTWKQQQLVAK